MIAWQMPAFFRSVPQPFTKLMSSFNFGERQLAQSGERRKALAEVVDRERDAVNAQLRRDLVHEGDVLDHLVLGDLQDEARPLVVLRPMFADERRKLQVGERADRGVDRGVQVDAEFGDIAPVAQRRL